MQAASEPVATVTETGEAAEDVERAYCLFHQHLFPTRYPAQPRAALALHRPFVVAERPGQQLICSCAHDGDHMWPDGDVGEA